MDAPWTWDASAFRRRRGTCGCCTHCCATALFLLQEQLRVSYGETTAYIIIVGALVMAVVLFLPDGLVSLARRARRMRLVRQLIGRARQEARP